MQTTSATFAPYADTRYCDVVASFRLVDNTAAQDATATATGHDAAVSQLAQTHDGIESMGANWATVENKGWPLDGLCAIMPDSVSGVQTGLWTGLSGDNGIFASNPTLTFTFSADHSSVGFTIVFDDKANWYPQTMSVTVYNAADAIIDSATNTVTSARHFVDLPCENYRKVVLAFSATQEPYQRVRVSEVIFGKVQVFDRDNTSGVNILYETTPTMQNLPTSELVITFDNTDTKYNLVSPDNLYAYLQQGQPIDVSMGVGGSKAAIEYVNMGRFYFARAEAEDGAMTARITAYDRLYQLDKSVCRIGVTGTWTVAEAVAAVIADSGLPITANIQTATGAIVINKCIPADTTHREALRLIAQAARCSCYFDRDGTLVFADLAAGALVDTLDNDNMSQPAKVTVSDRINTVELTVRDDYAGTENIYTAASVATGETAQVWAIDNPLAYDGNSVAAWLLTKAQVRINYTLAERGNPAREIGDTVTIYDAYGGSGTAVVVRQEYAYDGSLQANTKALSST